jgi:cytidine deaminase
MNELLNHAKETTKYCYIPYSNFHVGCALLFQDGSVVTGVNIENAAYSVTNCAERSALFSAISQGKNTKEVVAVAVVTDGHKLGSPCGVCRQAMSELLLPHTPVYLGLLDHPMTQTTSVGELLPYAFSPEHLHG